MTVSFTDRELDVMAVLWERGPSTVAEVREAIEDELAYTTVLTVLRTLEEKGYAAHEEAGRAYRYYAAVEREAAGRSALGRMLGKLFAGSPELLLTQLVRERAVDPDALRRMREMLDARLGDAPAEGAQGGAQGSATRGAGRDTKRAPRGTP